MFVPSSDSRRRETRSTHYLTPLLAPASVALLGATERPGALGRFLWQNLKQGSLQGALYAVNPKHRTVFGERSYRSLGNLPERPDLAIVATPARTVPGLIEQAGKAGIRGVLVVTSGFAESGAEGKALQDAMLAAARRHRVRFIGPNCLGLIRTGTGLNATFARGPALPGKLALVSQSGAVFSAILDWAHCAAVGFSSMVSLGGAADLDFGEVLDFLTGDPDTEAILMYIEGVRDARRFMSALRAAARVKPVIALKVGRFASGSRAASSHTGALVGSDAVFDAALRRAGTVRVRTYTQLFAAARVLATGRLPAGEHLAILTNGGGPGVIAADSAAENGVRLASLAPATIKILDAALPAQWSHGNPIDLIGDADARRYAAATRAALDDPGVDALLAMYCPVALTSPEDAARALAEGVAGSDKPVLAAWLGDVNRNPSRAILEQAGIPDFYTPENAVEAFSFLCAYRRNQAQLLQAPAALAEASAERSFDVAAATAIRERVLAERRTTLTELEARALLAACGMPVTIPVVVENAAEAAAAAGNIGFPVVLKIHSPDVSHKSDVGGVRLDLKNAQQVSDAFNAMLRDSRARRPDADISAATVQPMLRFAASREVLIGVAHDAVFGPVISFGSGGVAVETVGDIALALPPLNRVLARELMSRTRVQRLLGAYRDVPAADSEALAELLLGISNMVCKLPWIRELDLNPVLAHPGGAAILDARIVLDPAGTAAPARYGPRYGHMAIHPYPAELEQSLVLRDGITVRLRPMRPEDTGLEQRFFDGLSERARYLRFQHHLPALSPRMIERFTQLDYDRELALIALDPERDEFIAVGRYVPMEDGKTAEFALAVADAWQARGLGGALLARLTDCARDAGYDALIGLVLNANRGMLDLAKRLGFQAAERDGQDITVVKALAPEFHRYEPGSG